MQPWPGRTTSRGEVGEQHVEQIGSVQAEVVDGRQRGQEPGNGGSIQSAVLCIGPPAAAHLDSLSQAEAPHDPHSVGREAEARTHFGQLVGLLVDTRRSHARTARWLRRDHRCRRPRWPLEADPRSLTITPRAPAQKARSPPARAGRRLQVEPPRDPAGRPVGRHQLKDLVQGHGGLRSRHSKICGRPSARGHLGCPPTSAPGAQPRYLLPPNRETRSRAITRSSLR